MMIRRLSLSAAVALSMLLFLAQPGTALTIKGVDFADRIQQADKTLYLNGAGLRKKFFISVYACALYLPHPTSEADKAIKSDVAKQVVMHFIHSKVDREKIVGGWNDGFFNNSQEKLPQLQERIDRFNGFFDRDLVSGDRVVLTYEPGRGTTVAINDQLKGEIPGADFMEALWAIWLGGNPADSGMKKGMLGQ